MKKIVSVIKPFTLVQNIFIYEDTDKIATYTANLNDIQNTLLKLTEEYQINNISLVGSKKFSKGIKEKIEQAEMIKYNENKIDIKLI